jgi:hypothetical protein
MAIKDIQGTAVEEKVVEAETHHICKVVFVFLLFNKEVFRNQM